MLASATATNSKPESEAGVKETSTASKEASTAATPTPADTPAKVSRTFLSSHLKAPASCDSAHALRGFASSRRNSVVCSAALQGRRCERRDCRDEHAVSLFADGLSRGHAKGDHAWCPHAYKHHYAPFLDYYVLQPAVELGLVRRAFADTIMDRYVMHKDKDANIRMNVDSVIAFLNQSLSREGTQIGLSLRDVSRFGLSMRNMSTLHDYFFKVHAFILAPDKDKDMATYNKIPHECCKSSTFLCFHSHFKVTPRDRVFAWRWILRLLLSSCPLTPNEVSRIISRVEKYALTETETSTNTIASLVSQLASLMMLESKYTWAFHAILDFGIGVDSAVLKREEERNLESELDELMEAEGEAVDVVLDRMMAGFDEDRLLRASLDPPSKNIAKLRVTSFTVDVGEALSKPFMTLFQSLLASHTHNGLSLPPSPTPLIDKYNTLIHPSHATAEHYTIPMHLFVFHQLSLEKIAEHFHTTQTVHTFKSNTPAARLKQLTTVRKWGTLAIQMVLEKNSIWNAWRVPRARDLLGACDSLMGSWVEVCAGLVEDKAQGRERGKVRVVSGREERECDLRWEGEEEVVVTEKFDSTASLLTYLYLASNSLKHTQFSTFDPLAFLHAARQLFEMYSTCRLFRKLHVGGETGDSVSILGDEVSEELRERFAGLVEEIWMQLPARERVEYLRDVGVPREGEKGAEADKVLNEMLADLKI
ncbi:hypothetical protein HDU98_012150 [Podochytrium sp. JEL0797]|nr:hypothetical protein HDU98_012150 [Podochytrium sp. JEL0797]